MILILLLILPRDAVFAKDQEQDQDHEQEWFSSARTAKAFPRTKPREDFAN
jgi:hypothetical protein